MAKATSSTLVQGYQISVTTWENDGDAYATKIFEGITESHARYIVFILRMFHTSPPFLGGYHESEIDAKMDDIICYHNRFIDNFGDVVFDDFQNPNNPICLTTIDLNNRDDVQNYTYIFTEHFIDKYVGRNFDEGAYDFYRNVECYTVIYVPETITLPDHTLQINEELKSITVD